MGFLLEIIVTCQSHFVCPKFAGAYPATHSVLKLTLMISNHDTEQLAPLCAFLQAHTQKKYPNKKTPKPTSVYIFPLCPLKNIFNIPFHVS